MTATDRLFVQYNILHGKKSFAKNKFSISDTDTVMDEHSAQYGTVYRTHKPKDKYKVIMGHTADSLKIM